MSSKTAASAPWWERMPDDYYRHRDGTVLDQEYPVQVRASAAFDRVLRTGLASTLSLALAPAMWSRKRMDEQRRLLDQYQEYADRADASEVFPVPAGSVRMHRNFPPKRMFTPSGIHSELLSFDGGYEPLCQELDEHYSRHKRNRFAHAQHWRHPDGPRPTLIFLHGYFASGYRLNSWGFSLPWFYKHGYDVVLYTLPFHGARKGLQHFYSGQGYLAGGLAHMNESMRHAVHDVRVLINYLQAEGAPSVGVSGLSLGGYLSALLAAVDDRLAFCIPNSPVVAPMDMALEWQPIGWLFQSLMRRNNLGIKELRHGTALHSPLTYAPVIDADRLMIIGGAGDRFTPPRYVSLLHEHWPGSHLHWFPGNHVLHLQQGDYLKLMKAFMDRHTMSSRKAAMST